MTPGITKPPQQPSPVIEEAVAKARFHKRSVSENDASVRSPKVDHSIISFQNVDVAPGSPTWKRYTFPHSPYRTHEQECEHCEHCAGDPNVPCEFCGPAPTNVTQLKDFAPHLPSLTESE